MYWNRPAQCAIWETILFSIQVCALAFQKCHRAAAWLSWRCKCSPWRCPVLAGRSRWSFQLSCRAGVESAISRISVAGQLATAPHNTSSKFKDLRALHSPLVSTFALVHVLPWDPLIPNIILQCSAQLPCNIAWEGTIEVSETMPLELAPSNGGM